MDNRLKVFFILLIIGAATYFTFKHISIIFSLFLIAFLLIFFYFVSDKIILSKYGAEKVKSKYITKVIGELSEKAGIREPKAYMIKLDFATALAVGRKEEASICITKDLLKKLDRAEIRAVIAYEIAYIKSNAALLGCIVAMIAGLIVSLAYFLRYFFDTLTTKKTKIGLVFFSIVLPVAALLLHLTISRKDKFKADLKASKLLGQPYTLIDALKKLEKEKAPGFEWSAHLFITSPLTRYSSILFSTHPSLGERIRRLRSFWKKRKKSAFPVTNL
ncbi:MAG: M48 family metalloprotease [Candidatus Pacearchaeota archaeon]